MSGFNVILAFIVAWAVSHLIKVVIAWAKNGRTSFREVVETAFKSGGMPSAHTADMVAVTMYLGLREGFESALFGLAAVVTVIIAYDAMNVRYAVGEMGKELNKVAGKKMKVYAGHTFAEVAVGAIIGLLVGFCVFWLTK